MNSSQHLLVLMSIILGLGLRDLLGGGRAAAVDRPREEQSPLPYLAGLLVLIATVQFWWYLFIVAGRGAWSGNFFVFAGVLLRPALLFLSAASVFPAPGEPGPLEARYLRNRGFIYLPLVIYEVQNFIESAANLGTVLHPAHLFHVLFTAGALTLAISTRPRLHRTLLLLGLLLSVAFIGWFSLSLD